MEPAFTVEHGQEPPVVPGQTMEGQGRGWRVGDELFLSVTVGFAYGVYRTRHSPRDLAFVTVTYYLFVVFTCCVAKLRQLQRDPAATAAEQRRVRIGVWVILVVLDTTVAWRVADATPGLALKLVLLGVFFVLHGLGVGLYFLFLRKGTERCDVELGQPAMALQEGLSPEEV